MKPILVPTLLLAHLEPSAANADFTVLHCKSAMQAEFDALMQNNTWSLFPLPPNRSAIGFKLVFRVIEYPDGSINKARLVAMGFHQQHGFDYIETLSPVVKPVTVV